MVAEPTKLTPLFHLSQKMGARFERREGWQVVESFGAPETEAAAARQGAALVDLSANGKIMVAGRSEAILHALGAPNLAIGDGSPLEGTLTGHLYRTRADQFFVSTPPEDRAPALAALEPASDVVITDYTHGWAEMAVVGPAAAELLSRLCGLDFHPQAFPDLAARYSSVAKTRQLILHHDTAVPAYSLVGDRSLAAYLWETILEAGRDLAAAPIGLRAWEELR